MKKSALLGAFVFSTLFACQNADEAATTTPEESTQVMNHSAKGYQLYTVREALTGADSISATLRATREMGYEKVESFGYVEGGFLGLSATDFKRQLQMRSLKVHLDTICLQNWPVRRWEPSIQRLLMRF